MKSNKHVRIQEFLRGGGGGVQARNVKFGMILRLRAISELSSSEVSGVCLSESSLLAYAVFTILQSGNHQFSIFAYWRCRLLMANILTQIRTERRSGRTEHRSLSGSKMFDNLKVFLIYFFQERDRPIEKIQQTTKIMKNSPISSVLLK